MKQFLLPILFTTLLLVGCGSTSAADPKSLVSVAKDNIKKAQQFHELSSKAKIASAEVQSFVAGWIEECKVKGYVLQMGQDGDPGCVVAPTAPPSSPQAQAPQTPPAAVTPQIPKK